MAVLNDSRRNGNVPLSKYEVGSQLGFVGDIGFTHFEAEYVALMGKSFNDKEGDADKWARTIISWLSQVGWVITADSVEIYGRTLPRYTTTLYKASCTDIRYKTTGERMECPEKDKTPSYYSDSIYLAWFKFAQITGPLQNSEALSLLRKHSYLRVDHFFESERSAFTPFYNKRVYSLEELADQQRTIWFIRNFEKGDSSHEIHSFSSSLNDDKNVDQEFRILPTQDVLWISDLHFSNRHHAFGILPGSDNRLQTRLHKELSELNQKEHTLSHIIISGDLTFEASKEEYASALEFVNFMRSTYNLNDNCYSICPGNHDLKFSEKPYSEDDKVTIAYDSSKEAYIDFYRQVFGADPTESLYSIRRFLTPDLVPIEVIAINSCLLQQDKDHFRGMGYVGNDQRDEIEGKMFRLSLEIDLY